MNHASKCLQTFFFGEEWAVFSVTKTKKAVSALPDVSFMSDKSHHWPFREVFVPTYTAISGSSVVALKKLHLQRNTDWEWAWIDQYLSAVFDKELELEQSSSISTCSTLCMAFIFELFEIKLEVKMASVSYWGSSSGSRASKSKDNLRSIRLATSYRPLFRLLRSSTLVTFRSWRASSRLCWWKLGRRTSGSCLSELFLGRAPKWLNLTLEMSIKVI